MNARVRTRPLLAWALMAAGCGAASRAEAISIISATVTDSTLVISGQAFGTALAPVVTLGAARATVTQYGAASITATLAPLPPPGTYQLSVQSFTSTTRSSTTTFAVTVGAAGPAGASGQSVVAVAIPSGSALCPNGGSEFLSASGYTNACNGADGALGAVGPQGVAGPQGPSGLQGPEGAAGPAGPPGSTGFSGPTGSAGPQGERGHGSYWIDRNGKFVGTPSTLFPYVTWADSVGILWGLTPEQVAAGMWTPVPNGIYASGTIEYFDSTDCSGAPYVLAMPTMVSTYHLSAFWYRPPTAELRSFTPRSARNWYTGSTCNAGTLTTRFYLDASLLVPMRPQADVLAELQGQGFAPPFTLVVR